MKIDFSAPINDINGEPMKDGETIITLGSICCTALLATYQDEQNIGGPEKVRRFHLAEHAITGKPQDVDIKDVDLLRTLIAKAFNPLVVGRAYNIIDPKLEVVEDIKGA